MNMLNIPILTKEEFTKLVVESIKEDLDDLEYEFLAQELVNVGFVKLDWNDPVSFLKNSMHWLGKIRPCAVQIAFGIYFVTDGTNGCLLSPASSMTVTQAPS